MASEQGTGKHPHKSTEEPYPHHEAPTTKGSESKSGGHSGQSQSGGSQSGKQQGSGQSGESSDLKSREYKDEKGNVHHHTRTYEEQHKGER